MIYPLVALVTALLALGAYIAACAHDLPDVSDALKPPPHRSIVYLSRSGAVLGVRGDRYAPPVVLDQMPPYVPAAFVAIEDRRFYRHHGLDLIGIARSLVADLRAGRIVQGGSTITQQLARTLFLTSDRTLRRKLQEAMLAVELEQRYSKTQILSAYLNRTYFGSGAYGIEAASGRYFGKPARLLTIGEAALLAGLEKGPNDYNPIDEPARAQQRTALVLAAMVDTHAISPRQRRLALATSIKVQPSPANEQASYFLDWLDRDVSERFGAIKTDLIVRTTLDLDTQWATQSAVRRLIDRGTGKPGVRQAAVVVLDGRGRIRAYLGGRDYAHTQFDRASQARRQAGSAFKPFVYLTALEQGWTPYRIVIDEPFTLDGWRPHNFEDTYLGPVTLETALAKSINTVSARLTQAVGPGNVAQTAHRLGIDSTVQTGPSIALGAVDVTPLEMARAYAPFSNGGFRVDPSAIEEVTSLGKVIYRRQGVEPAERVIPIEPLAQMVEMLRSVVIRGTGAGARIAGYDLAGKTGTSSGYRDAWFIGLSRGLVCAVWVGKDDNTPMRSVTGGGVPARIWRAVMSSTLPRLGPPSLIAPLPPPIGATPADGGDRRAEPDEAAPSLGPQRQP